MMKMTQSLVIAGIALAICSNVQNLAAQNNPPPQGGRQGRGGPPDAAQIQQWQQQRMDRFKEQLEIKDDTEWSALQPLIQKVTDTQRAAFADRARGMLGGRNRGGDNNQGDQGGRRGGLFGSPSPEAEALQKAIDGKASKSELKTALENYLASRKAKQADLEKAQAELRKVLSVRQEAIATASGLL